MTNQVTLTQWTRSLPLTVANASLNFTSITVKKNFKQWLCIACFLTAACLANANSSNGKNQVLKVGIHDSGHALVTLSGAANTEACAKAGLETTIVIQNTNPNFKLMYATALTAKAAGKPVEGWVNGCKDLWTNGTLVPNATSLYIVD